MRETSKSADSVQDEEIVPFESFLGRDIKTLRLIGLHSLDAIFTGEIKKTTIWENLTFEIPMINMFVAIFFEFGKVVDLWGKDLEHVIGISASMVAGFLCFVKGVRLWSSRGTLINLLHNFFIMWKEVDNRKIIRKENLRTAAMTYRIGKWYIMMVTILSLTYALRPYAILLNQYVHKKFPNESYDYKETVYEARYPWSTDTFSKYVMCVTWEQFVIAYVVLYWIGADIMFAQLTTQATIQFRILWHDLKYVTNSLDEQNNENEKKMVHLLAIIAERHRNLYKYCESIQEIYNPLLFLTLLFTAANLCFCSFHLQKVLMQKDWEEVVKMFCLVGSVAAQLYVYCSFSEKLTEETSMMAEAAYSCQWVERGPKFKVMLHIIMIRAQQPFTCSAYGFFFVNFSQMSTIFRTAGSYFTLLQSLT